MSRHLLEEGSVGLTLSWGQHQTGRKAAMLTVGTSAEAIKDGGVWEQQSHVLERYLLGQTSSIPGPGMQIQMDL